MTWWTEHLQTVLRELRGIAATCPQGRARAWELLQEYEARPEYRGILAMAQAAAKEVRDE